MNAAIAPGDNVVLRTDGGGPVGYGHLRRCLALAGIVAARGGQPTIALGVSDAGARTAVADAGWPLVELAEAAWFDAASLLATVAAPVLTICDVSHPTAVERITALPDYVAALRANGGRVAMIDAPGDMCLAAKACLPVDLLVIPYAGAEQQAILPGPQHTAAGTAYAIVDPVYVEAAAAPRQISATGQRVLVTAGGSDPTDATMLCLAALEEIAEPVLSVHVVVGPSFTESMVARIGSAAATSRHDITLIAAPSNLAAEMSWCDAALSASGVTKYELACTGTPALLFSIDDDHHALNGPFRTLGTAGDLGVVAAIEPRALADELASLLTNPAQRRDMAAAGRLAVDGCGGERLFDTLQNTVAA